MNFKNNHILLNFLLFGSIIQNLLRSESQFLSLIIHFNALDPVARGDLTTRPFSRPPATSLFSVFV